MFFIFVGFTFRICCGKKAFIKENSVQKATKWDDIGQTDRTKYSVSGNSILYPLSSERGIVNVHIQMHGS